MPPQLCTLSDGCTSLDANQAALQSKIEALECQLKKEKKGCSVNAQHDERLEGELFYDIRALLMYLAASRKCSLAINTGENTRCRVKKPQAPVQLAPVGSWFSKQGKSVVIRSALLIPYNI